MAIGLGVVLGLVGLVLMLDVVAYDIPNVADERLGLLLLVAGVLAVGLSLLWSAMVSRRDRVVEHRQEPPHHREWRTGE
jgi:hypothetical protein